MFIQPVTGPLLPVSHVISLHIGQIDNFNSHTLRGLNLRPDGADVVLYAETHDKYVALAWYADGLTASKALTDYQNRLTLPAPLHGLQSLPE